MRLARALCSEMALVFLTLVLLLCGRAHAGGPRFVTGTAGWWVDSGHAIPFATNAPLYFTDPGTLAAGVTHAQADAMVAAAAAPWNVPSSMLTLAQGGSLAEHVSAANSYFDGSGMVFPTDVQPSYAALKPIAVVYDTDGSVIDLLLGAGASSPSGCRQNGVVESVDAIGAGGTINHAVILLNGRCVGTGAALAPSLLQLQYQTMRAFGRVLGVAWAQVNDAVFTGATALNASMIANWPVMHPIDVVCATYTYQCMTNPFTLRADDLATLALLYPVTAANIPAGKVLSTAGSVVIGGGILFPTSQGMSMVNMTVRRQQWGQMDTYEVTSALTGMNYVQDTGNPVSGPESQQANVGNPYPGNEGSMLLPRIPEDINANLWVTTTAINPLYTGSHALGPYQRPPLSLSGSPQSVVDWTAGIGTSAGFVATLYDAANACNPGADGSESAPAAFDPTGWRSGLFCGMSHSSWFNVSIRQGHTWTIEATAVDEQGSATNSKAQPVLGVWRSTDATGTLPTVAAQAAAMNSMSLGTTQLRVAAPTADTSYRIVFADQFGGGRPDLAYNGRVLYADAIAPAVAGAGGGQVTLTGTGFRLGNRVTVNGVAATVLSWTPNAIVLNVPTMSQAGATAGRAVTVAVLDASTNGATSIPNAFTYTAAPDALVKVSAPEQVATGGTAATPIAVRVTTADGLVAVAGAQVRLALDAASTGSVQLTACGAASSCVLTADGNGLVQTGVTGLAAGSVTVIATQVSGGAQLPITFPDVDPLRSAAISQPTAWVAAGATGSWNVALTALQDHLAGVAVPVVWTASNGLSLTALAAVTDASGQAGVTIHANSLPAGTLTVTGCAWNIVCATWTLQSVEASQWQLGVAAGAGQQIAAPATFAPVTLTVTDGNAHPLQLAPVTLYQRAEAYEGPCPASGRCAAAPTLGTTQSTAFSDANGQLRAEPFTVGTAAQVVALTASSGTQGFVSLTLVRTP